MHRLYYLKTFVHKGRGVYRYLGSHAPVRVAQSLLRCHFTKLPGAFPEKRTTGRGKKYSFQSAFRHALQTLKNRRMFAVYRQKAHIFQSHRPFDKRTGSYKGLLVCKGYVLAGLNSGNCGLKACDAYYCIDHGACSRLCRGKHCGVGAVDHMCTGVTHRCFELLSCRFIRNGGYMWVKFAYLLLQKRYIFICGQRGYFITVTFRYVKRLRPYRSGRAEHRYRSFHKDTAFL